MAEVTYFSKKIKSKRIQKYIKNNLPYMPYTKIYEYIKDKCDLSLGDVVSFRAYLLNEFHDEFMMNQEWMEESLTLHLMVGTSMSLLLDINYKHRKPWDVFTAYKRLSKKLNIPINMGDEKIVSHFLKGGKKYGGRPNKAYGYGSIQSV